MKLSHSQGQLAHRPSLWITNEPTSALDPEIEKLIEDRLKTLRDNYTALAIARQRSLINAADQVFRLEYCQLDQVTPSTTTISMTGAGETPSMAALPARQTKITCAFQRRPAGRTVGASPRNRRGGVAFMQGLASFYSSSPQHNV